LSIWPCWAGLGELQQGIREAALEVLGSSCRARRGSSYGSIYGAIGIIGNEGRNIHVPDVSLCR
jgi:hypothetical protein